MPLDILCKSYLILVEQIPINISKNDDYVLHRIY